MVEIERETFTVKTIGVGQPDYSQSAVTAERALVVTFPQTEVAGKKYDDYTQINFTAAQQEYVIGTNANNSKAGSWPAEALANEIQFYATANCWVRFNSPDVIPQFIPANLPLRFSKRTQKFYVYQDTEPGTLHAWIEG